MLNKVRDFIVREELLLPGQLYIVALSGGADSVCLLRILQQLGYRIEAAHCNFHLRGEESDRDETFVKSLCSELGVVLHIIHFDTNEYASLHQVSIEMAARDLRYGYFRQLCQDIGAAGVCVAHHRDDAVETLLMNLLRGSGIHGLTGIRPKNGLVVRPLLGVSRKEIDNYLHSIGQDYVTDSTNLVDEVLRNKIRLTVLPLLRDINPKAAENIDKTAGYLREAEKIVDDAISIQKAKLVKGDWETSTQTVSIPLLFHQPSPKIFLHEWLAPFGFNTTQVQQILYGLHGEPGREFLSPTHTLMIDRGKLILSTILPPMKTLKIPEEGNYRYDENKVFRVEFLNEVVISKSADRITLDADAVHFPLALRPVQTGDRFSPFGMKGRRLVSDFLTDLKLSLLEKRRQLVVTDRDGQIVWLVGLRIDNRFRVTPQTARVLHLSFC